MSTASDLPHLVIRVTGTYDGQATSADITVSGSHGVVVTGDRISTEFHARRLWPVVRDLLPPMTVLRANPAPTRARERTLPDDLADRCRAFVAITVTSRRSASTDHAPTVLRTWLATERELYAGVPSEGTLKAATPGALAETLIWDVAGAMEHLTRELDPAS